MSSDKSFKKFITSLLSQARVKEKSIKLFTDEASMLEYRTAFTHKSYGDDNYELYEFVGDTIVNHAVADYIHDRFPRIVSVKWLTRIKHNLMSNKVLATFVEKNGWVEHIRFGEEMQEEINSLTSIIDSDDHIKILGDVFEAFAGTLTNVVNKKKRRGVGYAVVYRIVEMYLDTHEMSLEYEDMFDAKSRLKELFDKYGWGDINRAMKSEREEDGRLWTVTVSGYPRGDKTVKPENKVVLSTVKIAGKSDAQQLASEKAIEKLGKYKISVLPPDPYER